MIHFWHLPRIGKEQVERRQKADRMLDTAKALNKKADQVADAHRRLRADNHFSQAIFGEPK